jgi:hypothetical protein
MPRVVSLEQLIAKLVLTLVIVLSVACVLVFTRPLTQEQAWSYPVRVFLFITAGSCACVNATASAIDLGDSRTVVARTLTIGSYVVIALFVASFLLLLICFGHELYGEKLTKFESKGTAKSAPVGIVTALADSETALAKPEINLADCIASTETHGNHAPVPAYWVPSRAAAYEPSPRPAVIQIPDASTAGALAAAAATLHQLHTEHEREEAARIAAVEARRMRQRAAVQQKVASRGLRALIKTPQRKLPDSHSTGVIALSASGGDADRVPTAQPSPPYPVPPRVVDTEPSLPLSSSTQVGSAPTELMTLTEDLTCDRRGAAITGTPVMLKAQSQLILVSESAMKREAPLRASLQVYTSASHLRFPLHSPTAASDDDGYRHDSLPGATAASHQLTQFKSDRSGGAAAASSTRTSSSDRAGVVRQAGTGSQSLRFSQAPLVSPSGIIAGGLTSPSAGLSLSLAPGRWSDSERHSSSVARNMSAAAAAK